MMSALGGAIQQLAKERGLSLSALADKIGVNRKTLYSCIHGNPRLSGLQRIADGLGFRLSDIIAIAEEIEEISSSPQQDESATPSNVDNQ